MTQREIAGVLNVSAMAVNKWLNAHRERGLAGLCSRPHPGAKARLSQDQLQLIPDFLSHGAEAYGFRGDVWTCPRVAKGIEQEFEVTYSTSHVSRLLKALNWTPQRPVERASQRDERAIADWRTHVWPDLKKKAILERRELLFVDESGFYLLPGCVRTYAPIGQTPLLSVFQTRDHLSVMSAITMTGRLFTLTRQDSLTGTESVLFLNHLHAQVCGKLLVIWDGSPIHRGDAVKDFLLNGGGKFVHLERLPAYAPDLNPDEGPWNYLKHVEMRNLCCLNLPHLHHQFTLAVARLRRKANIIQSFFPAAGVCIP